MRGERPSSQCPMASPALRGPGRGRERHGSTNTKLISIHYRTKFEDWWVSHATFDLCVQGSLELQHVGVLLGVHMVVGEDGQVSRLRSAWRSRERRY